MRFLQIAGLTRYVLSLCLFTVSIMLFPLSHASAQEINATLIGTVTDPTGGVVPDASVVVHNNETNTDVRTVKTDGSGNFTVTNLPAATYTVTVKRTGFRAYTANNVVLNVAQKRPLNVQLQPGSVAETITVNETTTPVQTTSAAQSFDYYRHASARTGIEQP